MFFHQAQRQPQAQAGSHVFFRGEERLENPLAVGRRNARTVVEECDAHAALAVSEFGRDPGGPYAKIPLLRKGLDGVGNQVCENLAELAWITEDCNVLSEIAGQRNLLELQLSRVKRQNF